MPATESFVSPCGRYSLTIELYAKRDGSRSVELDIDGKKMAFVFKYSETEGLSNSIIALKKEANWVRKC